MKNVLESPDFNNFLKNFNRCFHRKTSKIQDFQVRICFIFLSTSIKIFRSSETFFEELKKALKICEIRRFFPNKTLEKFQVLVEAPVMGSVRMFQNFNRTET